MTQAGYAFLGLTAIVAALSAVLVFAMLRFAANARDARRSLKESGETPLLAAALQEARSSVSQSSITNALLGCMRPHLLPLSQ